MVGGGLSAIHFFIKPLKKQIMKNLLTILPILVTPLNAISWSEDSNNIITMNAEMGQYDHTDATAHYTRREDTENADIEYNIAQKYYLKSDINNYMDVAINNYSYCEYQFNRSIYQGQQYYFETYAIYQIRPYNSVSDTAMDITTSVASNFDGLGTSTKGYSDIRATAFKTEANLSGFMNISTWSGYQYANASTFYQQILDRITDSGKEKQELEVQIADREDLDIYTYYGPVISLNDVNLLHTTTYIVIDIWASVFYENHQESTEPTTPVSPTTELLNTKQTILTAHKLPVAPMEFIDIPGMMFTILTMPFSFISQAFDVTLFPGTAYQVNISNMFLGFIAIAILLWVLKLIMGNADLSGWIADQKQNAREAKLQDRKHKDRMARETKRHQDAMALQQKQHKNKTAEAHVRENQRHQRASKGK